ncbi:transporter substrate-binding domain-containing protein [Hoeflea sp.]|uniref:transporter substrate-binding domain-containing protein n=1 Tax=Hoeflea sp. TaxID=1940281 RepID=UPI003B01F6AD
MTKESIKIGVLFSQTGPMAVTENAHIQGILLACEQINAGGGVNGQPLEPVVLDPGGDDRKYAECATELFIQHQVNVIFGCCLSTSRKAVLPIVERYNGVLFYPSVYEGFEYSPSVIYGGAVPNQVVLPLLDYIFRHQGSRIALIGSDTLYAREINRIVNEFLDESGGIRTFEAYVDFGAGSETFGPAIEQIRGSEPDAIVSTVVGQDSVTFYDTFAAADLIGGELPIASLTTTESELARMRPEARAGHLSVASYFSSLNNDENRTFLDLFADRYPANGPPCVYTEVCYVQVHLLADALRVGSGLDTNSILAALSGAVFKGPGGNVYVDPGTNHTAARQHIGRATEAGTFDIVWSGTSVVVPDPYLVSYERSLGGELVE